MEMFLWKSQFVKRHGVDLDIDAMVANDVQRMVGLLAEMLKTTRPAVKEGPGKYLDQEEQ